MTFSELVQKTGGRTGGAITTEDVDVITEYYRNDPEIIELLEAGANGISIRCTSVDRYEEDMIERKAADKALEKQCQMWGV